MNTSNIFKTTHNLLNLKQLSNSHSYYFVHVVFRITDFILVQFTQRHTYITISRVNTVKVIMVF